MVEGHCRGNLLTSWQPEWEEREGKGKEEEKEGRVPGRKEGLWEEDKPFKGTLPVTYFLPLGSIS
jgi:hypothetical protein